MQLNEFLDWYFGNVKKVCEFHVNYLESNGFKNPKNNYLELKRFIDTATNFLSEIDTNLVVGLVGKMYNDIASLYEFYTQVKKSTLYPEMVFQREYLERLEEYKRLNKRYNDLKRLIAEAESKAKQAENELKKYEAEPKDEEELKKYKALKKQMVDALYNAGKYKEEFEEVSVNLKELERKEREAFIPAFIEYRDKLVKCLERVINTKIYYYDKLLWYNAEKSPLVRKFFETSRINGDYSTKTFIKYFLKNIDINKSHNSDWIMYLKKMLKVVE
jgi:hypothetical protein